MDDDNHFEPAGRDPRDRWRDTWLQAGLDPFDNDDYDRIVRIKRASIEADDRAERAQDGRTKIVVGAVSAGLGAMMALATGWLPGAWKWLQAHIQ